MARGRKSKDPDKQYFGAKQEWAVGEFINTGNTQAYRDEIYKTYLQDPINKMCESIINTYKLHSNEMTFEELMVDTIGFLHTKMDKFKPSKNKKAFSYYGTIIKNRLLGRKIKETVDRDKVSSYEDQYSSLAEDSKFIDPHPSEISANHTLDFFYEFPEMLKRIISQNNKVKKLKELELTIAECLLDIMNDWEDMYRDIIESGGVKFNKSLINDTLRDMTGLPSKDVRDGLKRLKLIYFEEKLMQIKRKESEI